MKALASDLAVPRQRLATDEQQRVIVATILAFARKRGSDAITTRATANRIGVDQGALFRRYPDKKVIWLVRQDGAGKTVTDSGPAGSQFVWGHS